MVRRRGCWWWQWWRERRDIGRASHRGLAADSPGSLSPPQPLQKHQVSETKRTVRGDNILGGAAGRVAWCFAAFFKEVLVCCSSYGFSEAKMWRKKQRTVFINIFIMLLLCDGADKHMQTADGRQVSAFLRCEMRENCALSVPKPRGLCLFCTKLRMIILPPPSPTCSASSPSVQVKADPAAIPPG
ncbi:hypothetical protein CHARACLAT_010337 [Characodon lateralis]|uniref:Uncharacterized protein n=1 Tax=Characodon lateralis TaxID=208331 RepID=A0ABU7D0H4_9TELE|nr:hypothetical protein [Characodon lateralis]